jgi:DsbC/DsbD-like thiol-disulfide interchange protein
MFVLRALCCASLIGLAAPAFAADPFSSDWSEGLKSSARLVLGDASGGHFHAGVEIKLAPGAITYWRNPGDAGLPPVFNFDGSDNVGDVQTLFPAPQRLNEGDGEAFGYDHSVILPIEIKAADPTKPATLVLKLNYAVCEKICVPARADLQLRLSEKSGPSPYAAELAAARAAAPKPVDWSSLAGGASLAAVGDKAWRFCLKTDEPQKRDLFVEAPAPWWFAVARDKEAPAGQSCFRITLQQKPDDQNLPVAVVFTVTGDNAFETKTTLGVGSP